jgi:CheY-like chemotaxis protein
MRPRILLAVKQESAEIIQTCLGSDYEYCRTVTEEAAEAALSTQKLDLVIISYHFDSLHPYRLIQHIRQSPGIAHLPILLVRAFQLFFQDIGSEDQIREAYLALGATAFFSLYDEEQRVGVEKAAEGFRDLVSSLLSSKS